MPVTMSTCLRCCVCRPSALGITAVTFMAFTPVTYNQLSQRCLQDIAPQSSKAW